MLCPEKKKKKPYEGCLPSQLDSAVRELGQKGSWEIPELKAQDCEASGKPFLFLCYGTGLGGRYGALSTVPGTAEQLSCHQQGSQGVM